MGNACSSNKHKNGTTTTATKHTVKSKRSHPRLSPTHMDAATVPVTDSGPHRTHMTPRNMSLMPTTPVYDQRQTHSPALYVSNPAQAHTVQRFTDPTTGSNMLTDPLPVQTTTTTNIVRTTIMDPVDTLRQDVPLPPATTLPIPGEEFGAYHNNNRIVNAPTNNFFDGTRFEKRYDQPMMQDRMDYVVREPTTLRDLAHNGTYANSRPVGVTTHRVY